MAFAGVKPGMMVADIFSAGGYYTELLAGVVGPAARCWPSTTCPMPIFARTTSRRASPRAGCKNVERRLVEASYMNSPPKSVDLVVIVMAYHDVYWIDEKEGWPEINTDGFIDSLKRMLKPGGKLLIVDHNAAAGTGKETASKLHRLNEDWAQKSLAARGFVFEKSYDGLRNPDDQLDKMVYDPAVKGKTDRYVHLYRLK